MEIKNLSKIQIEQDQSFGFPVKFKNDIEKYQQLTKELVGLFGEVGEFSNIVKKINLKLDNDKYNYDIDSAKDLLAEELADSLIYILRISEIIDVDLEEETLRKMKKNRERYNGLR
ncbi:MazG nucleotide pyrophosphohydrolase domain-containing protein [Vibrio splendidus]